MVKKIRTIEDLMEISGTAAANLGGRKSLKNQPSQPSKPSKPSKSPKKPRKSTKTVLDEVNEITDRMPTYDELYPVDFDILRETPYPLAQMHRNMDQKEMEKLIASAEERSRKFVEIYENRVGSGDNSRGFKIVSINILREAKALTEYLQQQVENT